MEAELGFSGSGILFQAQHLVLPRRALIKVVHSAFAAMQPYRVQTLREACILEAIAHPGVPIVYESGILRDRRPWFAFEWLVGPTLEDRLAPGPMSVIEVAGLLRDLADILEHAHRRGVIYRGLRPDRVVIATERRTPLCIPDWSEAITHDATAHAPWAVSEEMRDYLAPELAAQASGGHARIDDRADMFALGVIAYRALSGRLPFVHGHDAASYVPVRAQRPDTPLMLAALIDSLLALEPCDRPGASSVRGDLDWLFEMLPELQSRAGSPRAGAGSPRAGAGSPWAGAEGSWAEMAGRPEDIVHLQQGRLRRPRWTPEVRGLEVPLETPHASVELTEDDLTK